MTASPSSATVLGGGTTTWLHFIHTDHLGTPKEMTNLSQEIIWRIQSKPFGLGEVDEDVDGDGQRVTLNVRFPGQYFDSETGLHYNYFRDYDPDIGRYLQSDPIGLKGGLNTYAYVGGNPVMWIDSLGLARQYGAQLSGAIGGGLAGFSLSVGWGISVPDDIFRWDCYQIFGSAAINPMLGLGYYAGFGVTANRTETDGPMENFTGQVNA